MKFCNKSCIILAIYENKKNNSEGFKRRQAQS